MMHKKISLFLVLILISGILFAADNAYEAVWDFGKVKEGDIVKHEFILKNDTAKELKILSVNTSCGCAASQAKKKLLAPGESTSIEVSFNSAKYSGDVKQSVYVNTDNVKDPLVVFKINADVIKN